MNELEVAVDPGFKGGQGESGGNSLRETVPLKDGAREGLLVPMSSQHTLNHGSCPHYDKRRHNGQWHENTYSAQ